MVRKLILLPALGPTLSQSQYGFSGKTHFFSKNRFRVQAQRLNNICARIGLLAHKRGITKRHTVPILVRLWGAYFPIRALQQTLFLGTKIPFPTDSQGLPSESSKFLRKGWDSRVLVPDRNREGRRAARFPAIQLNLRKGSLWTTNQFFGKIGLENKTHTYIYIGASGPPYYCAPLECDWRSLLIFPLVFQ